MVDIPPAAIAAVIGAVVGAGAAFLGFFYYINKKFEKINEKFEGINKEITTSDEKRSNECKEIRENVLSESKETLQRLSRVEGDISNQYNMMKPNKNRRIR